MRVASRGQRILSIASVPGGALFELGRAVVSGLVCTLNQFKTKFEPMKPDPPVIKNNIFTQNKYLIKTLANKK